MIERSFQKVEKIFKEVETESQVLTASSADIQRRYEMIRQYGSPDRWRTLQWRLYRTDIKSMEAPIIEGERQGTMRRIKVRQNLLDPEEAVVKMDPKKITQFINEVAEEKRKVLEKNPEVIDPQIAKTRYTIIHIDESGKPFRNPLISINTTEEGTILRVFQNYEREEKLSRSGSQVTSRGNYTGEDILLPIDTPLWLVTVDPREAKKRGKVLPG